MTPMKLRTENSRSSDPEYKIFIKDPLDLEKIEEEVIGPEEAKSNQSFSKQSRF